MTNCLYCSGDSWVHQTKKKGRGGNMLLIFFFSVSIKTFFKWQHAICVGGWAVVENLYCPLTPSLFLIWFVISTNSHLLSCQSREPWLRLRDLLSHFAVSLGIWPVSRFMNTASVSKSSSHLGPYYLVIKYSPCSGAVLRKCARNIWIFLSMQYHRQLLLCILNVENQYKQLHSDLDLLVLLLWSLRSTYLTEV